MVYKYSIIYPYLIIYTIIVWLITFCLSFVVITGPIYLGLSVVSGCMGDQKNTNYQLIFNRAFVSF